MFPHTATVYNKYTENRVEKWQRTVVRGVFWNAVKGATIRKTGISTENSLQLIIPRIAQADRAYKPPNEWKATTDKDRFWTLQNGDTVVKGELVYEIVKTSAELASFDDVRLITAVDEHAYSGMSHWEVSGK